MKMKKLFAIYRSTKYKGMVEPQIVPDNLFNADKCHNEFYKRGRELYTIERLIQLTK